MTFKSAQLRSLAEFQEADLFSEDGASEFSSTMAMECLDDILSAHEHDSWLRGAGDVRMYLTTNQVFIDVVAWKRAVVPDNVRARWAENIAGFLREMFEEEYTHPEYGDDRLRDADRYLVLKHSRGLVDTYLSIAKVWQCEPLRS